MCGIAGLVSWGPPVGDRHLQQVRAFCAAMAHRGPDGEGFERREHAVLGHRRLAVMDLSAAGRQPMGSADGRTWVVCNGEIYNHRVIRTELEAEGFRFDSHCDTEVLVHGYRAWGLRGLVGRLRGMFAFAVWDELTQTLWLVRDRLGVKPLYYTLVGGEIAFASEIRPLYDLHPPTAGRIDPVALDSYLTFGNLPPDRAILRDIQKLPPGTALECKASGQRPWKYWMLPEDRYFRVRDTELLSLVEDTLADAVVVRLDSDVPLGSFLSGGIDSGLVTGYAAEALSNTLTTLSVGFEGTPPADSELPLARAVATRYGTAHHELHLDGKSVRGLPLLLWMAGEPFGDSSLVPTAAVCRAARQSVTVALTGDGGDEIFAGYYRVLASYWGARARRMIGPRGARVISTLLRQIPIRQAQRAATVFAYGGGGLVDLYAEQVAVFHSDAREQLYTEEWLAVRGDGNARDLIAERALRFRHLPLAEAQALMDIEFQLPGRYLPKLDTASSMYGLECRSPFLDQQLVEFATTLPLAQVLRRGRQKGLLRAVAADRLPSSVVRAPKRGFGPSRGGWLRHQGAAVLRELRPFEIGQGEGPLRAAVVEQIVTEHLTGQCDRGVQVWTLLCLEIWWRLFVTRTLDPTAELGAG